MAVLSFSSAGSQADVTFLQVCQQRRQQYPALPANASLEHLRPATITLESTLCGHQDTYDASAVPILGGLKDFSAQLPPVRFVVSSGCCQTCRSLVGHLDVVHARVVHFPQRLKTAAAQNSAPPPRSLKEVEQQLMQQLLQHEQQQEQLEQLLQQQQQPQGLPQFNMYHPQPPLPLPHELPAFSVYRPQPPQLPPQQLPTPAEGPLAASPEVDGALFTALSAQFDAKFGECPGATTTSYDEPAYNGESSASGALEVPSAVMGDEDFLLAVGGGLGGGSMDTTGGFVQKHFGGVLSGV